MHLRRKAGLAMARVGVCSRRALLAGALGGAVGWVAGSGPAAAQGTPAAGGTREFIDVTGQPVRVPDRPERIVAIHDINAGAQVLALGGPLVGITSRSDGIRPDLTRYFDLSGVEDVGLTYELDLEAIVALAPDLIVGEGYDGMVGGADEAVLERLRELAPVVGIDTFRPVEEVMADYAALLGPAAQVDPEAERRAFEADLSELQAVLGDGWEEVMASLVSTNTGGLEAWGPTALVPTDVLSRMGVSWVPLMEEAWKPGHSGYIGDVSMERLAEFSADLVLVQTAYEAEILEDPLFQALPAVRAGQVIELSEPFAGTHYPNYRYVVGLLRDTLAGLDLRTDLV